MADPELRSDERVLVRTQGVYVKSIPFEGILTNKRIILVDRAKNLLPPKEIPLNTIKGAEAGENAIRDQIITLSVLAQTGETRQMILTFSRQAGGNRIKERDTWARIIKENASSPPTSAIRKIIPGTEPVIKREEPVPRQKYEIVHSPIRQATPPADRPVRRSPAPVNVPPVPAAAGQPVASVPATVFCSKCGNRIPAESLFCNRCGSSVTRIPPAPAPEPAPAVEVPASHEPEPAKAPEVFAPAPAPVQSAPAPVVIRTPSTRPIDEEIRSIEPLIERSTENIPNDALMAEPVRNPFEEPAPRDSVPMESSGSAVEIPALREPVRGHVPVSPVTVPPPASPSGSHPDTPPPPRPPKNHSLVPGRNTLVTAAIAVVAIILVAAGAFVLLPMLSSQETGTGGTTPVPTIPVQGSLTPSTTATIKERAAVVIPVTGVYVHVNYLGGYKGSYGMTDMVTTVPGNSGDRVWEVENANGTVQAEFEKLDGSAHELLVEIYKDGKVLTSGTTTVGHGSVALSVDTITGIAAAPVTSGGGSSTRTSQAPVTTTVLVKSPTQATTVQTTTAAAP